EGRVRVRIEADKDVRIPPDSGEILAAREIAKGPIAAFQDGLVPDDLAVNHHEGFNHLIDLRVVLKRQPSISVSGPEVGFMLQRRSVDIWHGGPRRQNPTCNLD